MSFYDNIELTVEELQAAILEGKKRKYFKEKNKGLLGIPGTASKESDYQR